jgi:phosphoheptose isomerase
MEVQKYLRGDEMNHPVITTLVDRYPELGVCIPAIGDAFTLLRRCFQGGGKLLVCGNGGSAADSEHIVGELMKGFQRRRPIPETARQQLLAAFPTDGAMLAESLQGALPAVSLVSQTALISAYANDVTPDMIFAQQVYGYGRPGDILLAISTSGNAVNVLRAVQVARALGLRTIGLTGRSGGGLPTLCDVVISVPYDSVIEIQERHLPVYHALCLLLEETFFS